MKSKNILALVAGLALAAISCQKPVEDGVAPQLPIPPRVSKISYTNHAVSYLYNTDGTLKETVIRENNGAQRSRYEYSYENGKITSARSGNIKLVYSYPNSSTVGVEVKGITGLTAHSSEFKFAGSRLLEWIQYTNGYGMKQPVTRVVHTYNNAGNIIRSEHYEHTGSAWMRYETVDVQYDNKVNYTSHVDNMPYHLGQLRILSNNPVKEEYRDMNGTVVKTVTYQHSFDAQGKKTRSVVRTVEDGLAEKTHTILFEY